MISIKVAMLLRSVKETKFQDDVSSLFLSRIRPGFVDVENKITTSSFPGSSAQQCLLQKRSLFSWKTGSAAWLNGNLHISGKVAIIHDDPEVASTPSAPRMMCVGSCKVALLSPRPWFRSMLNIVSELFL